MFQILIIGEEPHIRVHLKKLLSLREFLPYTAESTEQAFDLLYRHTFDLVILDAQMTGEDSISLITRLREEGIEIPVFMFSAFHRQNYINQALQAGVDDFICAPINEDEFILRIRSILKRAGRNLQHVITAGSTVLNYNARTVMVGDQKMPLPRKEFELLFMLLSYPDQVFSREQLMEQIWGPSSTSDAVTVCVHINRLRKRFRGNPDFQILTVREVGYKASLLGTGLLSPMCVPDNAMSVPSDS